MSQVNGWEKVSYDLKAKVEVVRAKEEAFGQ